MCVRVKQELWTVTTRRFISDNETSTGEDTLFIAFVRTQIFICVRKIEKVEYGITFVMCGSPLGRARLPLDVFCDILYMSVYRKPVEKIQVSLKSDENSGYCT